MSSISSSQICKHAIATRKMHENPQLCRAYVDQAREAGGPDQALFDVAVQADNQLTDPHLKYHMLAHAICQGEEEATPLRDKMLKVAEGISYGCGSNDEAITAQTTRAEQAFFTKATELTAAGPARTAMNTALHLIQGATDAQAGAVIYVALKSLSEKDQNPVLGLGKRLLDVKPDAENQEFFVQSGKTVLGQLTQVQDPEMKTNATIALGVAQKLQGEQALSYLQSQFGLLAGEKR